MPKPQTIRVLPEPLKDYFIEVSRGNVSGTSAINIPALSDSIGRTSFEDIWEVGGNLTYATSAENLEVVSDNVNDTSAGSGARTIFLTTLDDNFDELSQSITLNGTTPVSVPGTHMRFQTAIVFTAGGTNANTGTITIRVASAGATRSIIKPNLGRTFNSQYTVPSNKSVVLSQAVILTSKNDDVVVRPFFRPSDGTFFSGAKIPAYQRSTVLIINAGGLFPEKTDITFRAISTNVNTSVTCNLQLLLFEGTPSLEDSINNMTII